MHLRKNTYSALIAPEGREGLKRVVTELHQPLILEITVLPQTTHSGPLAFGDIPPTGFCQSKPIVQ